jgi:hypothetical protein
MIKLQPVMIELIILIILEVYANDLIPLSPTPTLLPTSLQRPFQLDHEEMTYIHRCLEFALKMCEASRHMEFCISTNLLKCLFNDSMHPKDYATRLSIATIKCANLCSRKLKLVGIAHATCIVDCYEKLMKKH